MGIDVARSAYAVKQLKGVSNIMLVTTSDFSRDLNTFKASRYDFDLRNYESVMEWLNAYKP